MTLPEGVEGGTSERGQVYLECPCCGGDGAESPDGFFYDGQPLICGCPGHVCVDEDREAWINNLDQICGVGHD